jgi:hypothetical protein
MYTHCIVTGAPAPLSTTIKSIQHGERFRIMSYQSYIQRAKDAAAHNVIDLTPAFLPVHPYHPNKKNHTYLPYRENQDL